LLAYTYTAPHLLTPSLPATPYTYPVAWSDFFPHLRHDLIVYRRLEKQTRITKTCRRSTPPREKKRKERLEAQRFEANEYKRFPNAERNSRLARFKNVKKESKEMNNLV